MIRAFIEVKQNQKKNNQKKQRQELFFYIYILHLILSDLFLEVSTI